jgi:hypothetical protein
LTKCQAKNRRAWPWGRAAYRDMKPRTDTPEMARFNDALCRVMEVSKGELKALLKDEDYCTVVLLD